MIPKSNNNKTNIILPQNNIILDYNSLILPPTEIILPENKVIIPKNNIWLPPSYDNGLIDIYGNPLKLTYMDQYKFKLNHYRQNKVFNYYENKFTRDGLNYLFNYRDSRTNFDIKDYSINSFSDVLNTIYHKGLFKMGTKFIGKKATGVVTSGLSFSSCMAGEMDYLNSVDKEFILNYTVSSGKCAINTGYDFILGDFNIKSVFLDNILKTGRDIVTDYLYINTPQITSFPRINNYFQIANHYLVDKVHQFTYPIFDTARKIWYPLNKYIDNLFDNNESNLAIQNNTSNFELNFDYPLNNTSNNKLNNTSNNTYYEYQDLYDFATFDPFDLNQEYQNEPDNQFNNDSQIESNNLQLNEKPDVIIKPDTITKISVALDKTNSILNFILLIKNFHGEYTQNKSGKIWKK